MIYTKRHEALELVKKHRNYALNKTMAELAIEALGSNVPHYVLTQDLIDNIDPDAVADTFTAMVAADVAKMPHNELLLETKIRFASNRTGTLFMLLQDAGNHIDAGLLFYDGTEMRYAPTLMQIHIAKDATVRVDNAPDETFECTVGATFLLAVVLSHTKGVAIEVVTSDTVRKLNKARAAKKRVPVMPHKILHIGHVYTKSGQRVKYDGDGSKRRPHLRKGHARRQKYGKNWAQERWVFIPACFVNYVEGDEEPAFPTQVIKW